MTIDAQDWNEIETMLLQDGGPAGVIGALRKRFPHLSWTRCDASDVTETPFRAFERFDVHLIDAADHCVRMTTELDAATGLVVADKTAPL